MLPKGYEHRKQRKLLNPAFSAAQMRRAAPVMQSNAQQVCYIKHGKSLLDMRHSFGRSLSESWKPMNRISMWRIGSHGLRSSWSCRSDFDNRLILWRAMEGRTIAR
jgi:hypothetical protein